MSVRQRKTALVPEAKVSAESAATRVKESLLVLWNDLPSWQQDNHYILSGYRPASGSYWKSFMSLGYLHNESVNIYSHLLGAMAFIIVSVVLYKLFQPGSSATSSDIAAFACFFLGAVLCLGISAGYHAISNHSHEVAAFGNKLDYVGIVFLIAGSFVPSIYYGFYCHTQYQIVYWTMISTIGFGCACVSILPKFRTPEWRSFRAGMFVLMGLSAVFPVLHGVFLFGVEQMRKQIGLYWLIAQGALYISGAGLYAARFPESQKPGAFDIWGSSHQIFHVLVLIAAATHLAGLLKAYDYRHGIEGGVCL